MREELGRTEAIIRPSRALLARRARRPRRQRARRARPCRLDALQLRLALLPSLPPWHGDVQGSPSSRTRRARAAVPGLSASSRSEPAEVGRGKWPFGPFNITRGCAKCAQSQTKFAWCAHRCAFGSAPFGFAQPALCLAPRPPSALCRVLLAHCTAEVSALVCKHTSAPFESGARAQGNEEARPPAHPSVRIRARPAAPQGLPNQARSRSLRTR
jgi:hypothetical protein